jgi:hypothetical protein
MKNLDALNGYRRRTDDVFARFGSFGDDTCGVFDLPSPATGARLMCIASSGGGWDHVSISLPNRTPNWREMELVKRTFFRDDETAMQLHVPPKDHISIHPNCLHLWRPNDGREIPLPPAEFVA